VAPEHGSLLHQVVEAGLVACAARLLDHGADPNLPNDDKEAPLHYAAWYGEVDMCRMLLGAGALLEARDSQERTPFLWAVRARQGAVVEELISQGADVKVFGSDGLGPLQLLEALQAQGKAGSEPLLAALRDITQVYDLRSQAVAAAARGATTDAEHDLSKALLLAREVGGNTGLAAAALSDLALLQLHNERFADVIEICLQARQELCVPRSTLHEIARLEAAAGAALAGRSWTAADSVGIQGDAPRTHEMSADAPTPARLPDPIQDPKPEVFANVVPLTERHQSPVAGRPSRASTTSASGIPHARRPRHSPPGRATKARAQPAAMEPDDELSGAVTGEQGWRDEARRLRLDLAKAEKDAEASKAMLKDASTAQIAGARATAAAARAEASAAASERDRAMGEVADLHRQLQATQDQVSRERDQRQRIRGEEQELGARAAQQEARLETELYVQQKWNQELRAEMDQKVAGFSAELQALQAGSGEAHAEAAASASTLSEELCEARRTCVSLQQANTQSAAVASKRAAEEARIYEAAVQQARDHASMEAATEQVVARGRDLERQRVEDLQAAMETDRQELRRLADYAYDLHNQHVEREREWEQVAGGYESRVRELLQELAVPRVPDEAQRQMGLLHQELERKNMASRDLQRQLAQKNKRMTELSARLMSLGSNNAEMKEKGRKIRELEDTIVDLRGQLSVALRKPRPVPSDTVARDQAHLKIETLKREKSGLERKVETLEQQLAVVQRDLTGTEAALRSVSAQAAGRARRADAQPRDGRRWAAQREPSSGSEDSPRGVASWAAGLSAGRRGQAPQRPSRTLGSASNPPARNHHPDVSSAASSGSREPAGMPRSSSAAALADSILRRYSTVQPGMLTGSHQPAMAADSAPGWAGVQQDSVMSGATVIDQGPSPPATGATVSSVADAILTRYSQQGGLWERLAQRGGAG